MAQRKKLLFLCQMFPLPVRSGGQLRSLNMIRRLGQRFDVTLLTLASEPGYEAHLDELRQHCARVIAVVPANKRSALHRAVFKALFWVRRLLWGESSDHFYNTVPNVNRAVRAELSAVRYDVVFCAYWYWDARVFDAPGLKVIDANDVQTERMERLLERSRNPVERLLKPFLLSRYRRQEARALARADLVVATTSKDRAQLDLLAPEPRDKLVLPTGLDTDYFAPQADVQPDARNIVFYGSLANPMNRDAVLYLVQDLLPRIRARVPDARLTIVGAAPPPEVRALPQRDARITVTGYVQDVRRPLAEAGVVVCPLRFGYGIRGRIFELLSMSIPVVATPVAVDGMDLASGDGLLLAEGAEALAAAVVAVVSDPTLRADLARRGRDIAVQRMSMAATYDRLAEILDDRTASRTSVAAGS